MSKTGLPKLNTSKEILKFLQESTLYISEVVTGLLVSDKNDFKLSAGHLVQSVIKVNLFTQLGREIENYRIKGQIKDDIFATDKNRMTFYEILKSIDEDVPDEIRFQAMKSIFLRSVQKDSILMDEELGYEFIKIARKVSSTEVLILKANFEIANGARKLEVNSGNLDGPYTLRDAWVNNIAMQMGYGEYPSVVLKYEENLVALGLISETSHANKSSFKSTSHARLTNLGFDFCKSITSYE